MTTSSGPAPTPDSRRRRTRKDLLAGPVGRTLLELAAPMVLGLAAVIVFGVVDTFYVGLLGPTELAAMSFTFPVSFFVTGIAMGMSAGMTSNVSRALGGGDSSRARCLTTDGLVLANVVVLVVALSGLLSIDPLFRALGADQNTLHLIRSYMTPWFLGVGFLVLPMVGNGAIRGTGDTKVPSYIMIVAGAVNIVLDPLLIFGIGPFPRLELQGAAIATVIAWVTSCAAALWVLSRREKLIDFSRRSAASVMASWRGILYVAGPAAGTAVLAPVGAGIITRMVSSFGSDAVAGLGVGTRVESLALIGVYALGTAIAPFAGQNYGAGLHARIREALGFGFRASVLYGVGIAAVLGAASGAIAGIFTDDPEVARVAELYLTIVPISYMAFGYMALVNATFNATNRPLRSTGLVALRLFLLAVPLAWLGARLAGVPGLFGGVAVANGGVGFAAFAAAHRFLTRELDS